MKTQFSSLMILMGLSLFATLQGQEMDADTARRHIEEIADADDFMDERLVKNINLLKKHSADLFPLWAEIVRDSENDRLLQITMTSARAASSTHANELCDLATDLLIKRDAKKFPLAIEAALHTLGAAGKSEHQNLIGKFEKHPNPSLQLAAHKASELLKRRIAQSGRSAPPVPDTRPTPPVSRENPPGAKQASIAPDKESPASTSWPWIAAIAALAASLAFFLKRKFRA